MRSVFAAAVALSFGVASTSLGAVYQISGGDAEEGLTLDAAVVVGAWSINGSAKTVQDVIFTTSSDAAAVYDAKIAIDGHVNYTYNFSFASGQTSDDDAALRDVINPGLYFYGDSYVPSKITISGLAPNTQYKIDVLSTGGGRTMHVGYNVESGFTPGQAVDSQELAAGAAYNFSNTATSLADGKLYVDFVNSDGAFNPVVSGLVISAVPEPATAGLLAFGSLLLARRTRRAK